MERVVAELAERFARDGHEVHVFAREWGDVADNRILFHRLRAVPMPGLGLAYRLLNFFVFSRLALRGKSFDITHCHLCSWRSYDVVTCHGTPAAWAASMLKRKEDGKASFGAATVWAYRLTVPLLNYNYRPGRHKRIIAVSESIKRELVELCGSPQENVVVIPNGVDLEEFHPRHKQAFRAAVRERHGLSEDDFVFLFVANFFKRKGLGCLLDAFACLSDPRAKLLVVGRDELNLAVFAARAESLGVADRVLFVGPSDTVNQYYAASDAFVFPTMYEACALVVLEAMAAGLPVITTRLAGAVDLLTDNVDALLFDDPHNPEGVAARMRLVMEDAELRARLSANARTSAERWSWEEAARKTMEVYREVLAD